MRTKKTVKKWISDYETCDVCTKKIKDVEPWFVDGKTKEGPWALMCPACFGKHGVGLGLGKGQKYNGKTADLIEGDR